MFDSDATPSTKAERTRATIRRTALESFRTRGYDETTLRLIANESKVSLGNAYYYFPTKNHLVQELYIAVSEEFEHRAAERLTGVDDLVERLRVTYLAGLEVLAPYHGFAPGFLAAAVSPRSPINPLSSESEPARDETVQAFRLAVVGAKHSLPKDLAADLPDVLMLAYLLLTLFWVYDRSEGQARTYRLLDRGLGLLKLGIPLLKVPGLRKPLRELMRLVAEVRA